MSAYQFYFPSCAYWNERKLILLSKLRLLFIINFTLKDPIMVMNEY